MVNSVLSNMACKTLRYSKNIYMLHSIVYRFLILIIEKESVFPFSMLSAKQGNYWYHFYNVFGMTRAPSFNIVKNKIQTQVILVH